MYEVYALRFATFRRPRSEIFLSWDVHDGMVDLDYFVWLIKGEHESYLVDTGFDAEAGSRRRRTLDVHPVDAIKALGVDPASIRHVVITHLHFDHAGNIGHFPNAMFHLQDDEMAFATGRCMCHHILRHPFNVEDVVEMVRTVYKGRVRFHQGDSEIAPGISIHLVPGHSQGLQVVRVQTPRGNVVLASDAVHFYANMEGEDPFPALVDVAAVFRGFGRLIELADSVDHIVPGHDHAVTQRYPRLAGCDVEAFCLHVPPIKHAVGAPAQVAAG